MAKIVTTKPVLIMPYGLPGAGKTYFCNLFSETSSMVHLNSDRIRHELFDNPTFSKQESDTVEKLMKYLAEEFLKSGVSIIYDNDLARHGYRRQMSAIARQHHAVSLVVWFQVDVESAFGRVMKRDKRKIDDRDARGHDRTSYDAYQKAMQNPKDEVYVVLSGKHTFNTQKGAVVKKLYELGLIDVDSAAAGLVKPGLVNLIPQLRAGRVDEARRNIVIR